MSALAAVAVLLFASAVMFGLAACIARRVILGLLAVLLALAACVAMYRQQTAAQEACRTDGGVVVSLPKGWRCE